MLYLNLMLPTGFEKNGQPVTSWRHETSSFLCVSHLQDFNVINAGAHFLRHPHRQHHCHRHCIYHQGVNNFKRRGGMLKNSDKDH